MVELLTSVAPIFILIALGAVLKLIKLASNKWIAVLNSLAFYVAFPALIFTSLANIQIGGGDNYSVFIWNSVLLVVTMLFTYLITWLFKLKQKVRNCYLIAIALGNVAYLGFPFITSVVEGSAGMVSIVLASYIAVVFIIGIWILESSAHPYAGVWEIIKNILKNPLLISVVLGLIFAQFSLKLPVVIDTSIKMLASAASPVVLVALGIFIARKIEWNMQLVHSLAITVIKLLVLPLLFFLFGIYVIKDINFIVPVLEAGMPVAITIFALSQIYPLDKKVVVYSIVISTVLSVITLPILTLLIL